MSRRSEDRPEGLRSRFLAVADSSRLQNADPGRPGQRELQAQRPQPFTAAEEQHFRTGRADEFHALAQRRPLMEDLDRAAPTLIRFDDGGQVVLDLKAERGCTNRLATDRGDRASRERIQTGEIDSRRAQTFESRLSRRARHARDHTPPNEWIRGGVLTAGFAMPRCCRCRPGRLRASRQWGDMAVSRCSTSTVPAAGYSGRVVLLSRAPGYGLGKVLAR